MIKTIVAAVGLLCLTARGASSQTFEHQVLQISQKMSGAALQMRQNIAASRAQQGSGDSSPSSASKSKFEMLESDLSTEQRAALMTAMSGRYKSMGRVSGTFNTRHQSEGCPTLGSAADEPIKFNPNGGTLVHRVIFTSPDADNLYFGNTFSTWRLTPDAKEKYSLSDERKFQRKVELGLTKDEEKKNGVESKGTMAAFSYEVPLALIDKINGSQVTANTLVKYRGLSERAHEVDKDITVIMAIEQDGKVLYRKYVASKINPRNIGGTRLEVTLPVLKAN